MNRTDFVGRLLKIGDAELVKSYFVGHPLTIEEMKEMLNSQYSEVFVEYIHSRLFNQQAEPVDVDAATEDTTSVAEDALASEAPAPVDPVDEAPATEDTTSVAEDALASEAPAPVNPVDEAPASETESQVELPDFLFHKIDFEELAGESQVSSDIKNALLRVIKLMKEEAGLVFWGELFTCRNRVERFRNLDNQSDFNDFTRNFEREMKVSLDAYFPGLEEALKPYLEAYAQEQAEKAAQDEARELLKKKKKFLRTTLKDLRESKLLTIKAVRGCKRCLNNFYKGPKYEMLKDMTLAELSEFPEEDMIGDLGENLARHIVVLCENINSGIFPED